MIFKELSSVEGTHTFKISKFMTEYIKERQITAKQKEREREREREREGESRVDNMLVTYQHSLP